MSQWECDVLTSDGLPLRVRPIRPEDGDALVEFHHRLSPETVYYRFFSFHPELSEREVEWFTHVDGHDRVALVALSEDRIVAVGRYDRRNGSDAAEVALVVDDAFQGRGIGTLLLEHLAVIGAKEGVARFVAEVLPGNPRMLEVFRRSGFEESSHFSGDSVEVVLPLVVTAASTAAIEGREHRAESRSIQRLLSPRSVAVVGASDKPGTVGQALMSSLSGGGFDGSVYPVNPSRDTVAGRPAYRSIRDIPNDVDLAVIAVPAIAVEKVVEDCAACHVKGLVIVTAGFAEAGAEGRRRERSILELAHRHGMRLVGPNCIGLINTAIGLDATFAPFQAPAGNVGFLSQSGAMGIALLERSAALGLGVSSFVSAGNKADVSGNDLLQYWEDDPATDVALLYLESFGNPRKFARIARRVSRRKPIVALKSGRSVAGQRAASSHTAAMASSDTAVDALFAQAGVIRVDTLTDLFDTVSVLAWQPLPVGAKVAIVGNSGGPETMTCDACAAAGLELAEPDQPNPLDLLASATPEQIEQATRALLRDDRVDAVVAVVTPVLGISADDIAGALVRAADGATKPLLACLLATADPPAALRESHIPWYSSPEAAVRALARVVRYRDWLDRDPGVVPDLDGIDHDAARMIIDSSQPGWLEAATAAELLGTYGIEVVPTIRVRTIETAVQTAARLGCPVALKTAAPDLVHKSDVGGVQLGLRSRAEVRRAARHIRDTTGSGDGFIVQPMVKEGVELIAGALHDPAFGPLLMLGAGGTAAEIMADRTYRILPLTDQDAHDMVRALRVSPLLFGYRGAPPASVDRLEDLLLRLARLVDDHPEIAELDCNPVIVTPKAATVVDVKIRLTARVERLPEHLRRLR